MANFYSATQKIKKIRKQQEVVIEKLDLKMQGLTYIDNKVVFVPQTLPGERVTIQVINEHKKYANATLLEIIEPSPLRHAPSCVHYDSCGGCQVQHLDNKNQLTFKEQALSSRMAFAANEATWQPAIESPSWHYRRRGRIGVNVEKNNKLRVGFRQTGSNELTQINQCQILKAPFDTLFDPLRELIETLDIRSEIGHVEFIASKQCNVMIFRCLKSPSVDDLKKLTDFEQAHQLKLMLEDNDKDITWVNESSSEPLFYNVQQFKIEFKASNFIQVNEAVNDSMVSQAIEWLALTKEDKVLDLFCGVGNFSLAIAKQAKLVVGVEGVKEMALQATHNAQLAGIDNVTFYHSNLAQPLSDQQWFDYKLRKKVDKILLDPSREGAMDICRQLSQLQPSRIVYVSCEPASLERDAKVIIEQGYKLQKICAMDMFPHTTHVESMALFVKAAVKPKRVKRGLGK
ncbi:MAG: 23S rRNA (uracil(1939)-C(5))-methyltransferase RlmD [Psychrobium sp.]|nr:23S rRNA (uracil(1939)-C(5))-methyltransferase RlmD [Psychrobium sp.]